MLHLPIFHYYIHLQVLNLFLALLLNAFASDTLRDMKEGEEENKLKIAFNRIYDLCCCCFAKKSSANAVSPNEGEDNEIEEIQNSGIIINSLSVDVPFNKYNMILESDLVHSKRT